MADILDLAGARKALRLPAADTADDGDLTETYIPAVTQIVESLAGPQTSTVGRTWTADGGTASILLPSAVTAVSQVIESGLTLTADSDYIVDLDAGVVSRGSTLVPSTFQSGNQNVVITYDTDVTATKNVVLAARIILRHIWQADNQGQRPDFGEQDDDVVMTPTGYLIPKRAYELLLGPTDDVPGFA